MFGKRSMFKSLVAIAVAASIAVVGATSAKAGSPYNPSAYMYGCASQQVSRSIQCGGGTLAPTGAGGVDQIDVTNLPLENGLTANQSAGAATTPVVTPTAQMARHFQHEDTIYGGRQQITSAPEVSQSIQAQDSEYQRFVTAALNLRALRAAHVHGFTIITDTLGGNGHPLRHAQAPRVDQGFRWLLDPAR
jgi:hypothetical protein